jgi:hypothetical protein
MKTASLISRPASRHSLGLPASPMQRVMRQIRAVVDFIVDAASPLAMPAHGFQPENDTLCGAHWNRVYLISGAKL